MTQLHSLKMKRKHAKRTQKGFSQQAGLKPAGLKPSSFARHYTTVLPPPTHASLQLNKT